MAITGNFKGTSNPSFKIGKGGAKIFGTVNEPTTDLVTGDIWIDSANTDVKVYDGVNWVSTELTPTLDEVLNAGNVSSVGMTVGNTTVNSELVVGAGSGGSVTGAVLVSANTLVASDNVTINGGVLTVSNGNLLLNGNAITGVGGTGGLTVQTTSVGLTAVAGNHYHVDTSGQTITLPASPSVGDEVAVSVDNFTDTVVARNGSNIAGAAQDFNINGAESYVQFRYVNATEGWTLVIATSESANGGGSGTGGFNVTTVSTNTTAVSDTHYHVDTGNVTITLPSGPTPGDQVAVSVDNFTNTQVARNGSNIAGAAQDFDIDTPETYVEFRYVDATEGWTVVSIASTSGGGGGGLPNGTDAQTIAYDGTAAVATSVLTTDVGNNIVSVSGGTTSVPFRVTNTTTSASIGFTDSGTGGASNVSIGSVGEAYVIRTQNTERMRVLGTGFVGIGNTDPDGMLDVAGEMYTHGASAGLNFRDSLRNNMAHIWASESDDILRIGTANKTTRMAFIQTGEIGIGTDQPDAKLHITATRTDRHIHIENNQSGGELADINTNDMGILMSSLGMNTTNALTPGLRFGSTDTSFTTTNPKTLAAIHGIAESAYTADTEGNMGLAFFTSATPGTTNDLQERVRIDSNGSVGIGSDTPTSRLDVSQSGGVRSEAAAFGSGSAAGSKLHITPYTTAATNRMYLSHNIYRNSSGTFVPDVASSGAGYVAFLDSGDLSFATTTSAGASAPDEAVRIQAGSSNRVAFTGNGGANNVVYIDPDRSSGGAVAIWSNETTKPFQFGLLNASNTANLDLYSNGTGDIRFITGSNQERARIDSDGNVGIGTGSPATKLTITDDVSGVFTALTLVNSGTFGTGQGTKDIALRFSRDTGGQGDIGSAEIRCVQRAESTSNGMSLVFYNRLDDASFSETMRINHDGRVGIGTDTPSRLLHMRGSTPTLRLQPTSDTQQGRLEFYNTSNGFRGRIGYDYTDNYLDFFVNGVERMRLDSNGRLGIGEVSPDAPLHVNTGANTAGKVIISSDSATDQGSELFFTGSNASAGAGFGSIAVQRGGNNNSLHSGLIFKTSSAWSSSAPTEHMRLDQDGRLLVNRTSSVGTATLQATGTTSDGAILAQSHDSSTTTSVFQTFRLNNGTGSGLIGANGANAATFKTYSDISLKENVQDYLGGLSEVLALRPVTFDWIGAGESGIGFIAQEVQGVWPDVVSEHDGKLVLAGLSKTEARLVSAIQELNHKVETLESEKTSMMATIADLVARVEALEQA